LQNKIGLFDKVSVTLEKIAVIFWLVALILISACGHTRLGGSGMPQGFSLVPGNLSEVWNQHTIVLAGQLQEMGRRSMMMPGTYPGEESGESRGERGETGGMFELSVRATLMDSVVIQSGLDEFAWLASLSPEEKQAYAERYNEEHYRDQYLFIWTEIASPFSDEYLKLDRWIFFLETESGEQLEPVKTVERSVQRRSFTSGLPADSTMENLPASAFGRRSFPYKIVQFYFPLKDNHGVPVMSPQYKKLKFVVVRKDHKEDREENSWSLEKLYGNNKRSKN
jgi:hypothetical protein